MVRRGSDPTGRRRLAPQTRWRRRPRAIAVLHLGRLVLYAQRHAIDRLARGVLIAWVGAVRPRSESHWCRLSDRGRTRVTWQSALGQKATGAASLTEGGHA